MKNNESPRWDVTPWVLLIYAVICFAAAPSPIGRYFGGPILAALFWIVGASWLFVLVGLDRAIGIRGLWRRRGLVLAAAAAGSAILIAATFVQAARHLPAVIIPVLPFVLWAGVRTFSADAGARPISPYLFPSSLLAISILLFVALMLQAERQQNIDELVGLLVLVMYFVATDWILCRLTMATRPCSRAGQFYRIAVILLLTAPTLAIVGSIVWVISRGYRHDPEVWMGLPVAVVPLLVVGPFAVAALVRTLSRSTDAAAGGPR